MGHGNSKHEGGLSSSSSNITPSSSTTTTTTTTETSTNTSTAAASKRRHRPHFHSQSLIRQASGRMMTPATAPASPTIKRTPSVSARINAGSTSRPSASRIAVTPSTPPSRRATATSSPIRSSPTSRQQRAAGTVQKVMKHDELYDLLESMGFPRSVVMETVEKLQVRGQRTVIDANALIEQLLLSSRLYASSNVIDSDQLQRRINELSLSRELSRSRGSPSIGSTTTPYSPSPLRPSSSSLSSSASTSSTSSDASSNPSETAEIFDPFGLIEGNTTLPPPLFLSTTTTTPPPSSRNSTSFTSNANANNERTAYNPFTNPSPTSFSSTSLIPVEKPPPAAAVVEEEDDLEGKCKICYDRPIDTVILRCGHLAICLRCSKQLKDCPICRKPITEIVRIYQV
eukprot:TRINITY_DN2855_c0_g1_i2.p1 TRINITY_DN2855_c0_g1~~TRINITY_DN2855_c0_g1_i2.p1  ORF type:complete len:400 (+),score=131.18 TRINITY_DN2855_c0_g1_i2:125-1324(+)